MSTNAQASGQRNSPQGANHVGLEGGAGAHVRFRPERLVITDPALQLSCRFECDGQSVGPVSVLDVSASGIGLGDCPKPLPSPGSTLKLELLIRNEPVWRGEAVVMHSVDTPHVRLGARFTSGLLNLRELQLRSHHIEGGLLKAVETLETQKRALPDSFRAAVGDLRVLLSDTRAELERMERGPFAIPQKDEPALFQSLLTRWGTHFYGQLSKLWQKTKELTPEQVQMARTYSASQLLPVFLACPIHRRAFEKPLGYAGDHHLMELYFDKQQSGDGLYGRFLHFFAQNYMLGRTVIDRVRCMRETVREVVMAPGEGPVRILSVACGPALELQQLIESLAEEGTELSRPIELFLLDQDQDALENCHHQLSEKLTHPKAARLPIKMNMLHFSVRQILKPKDAAEVRVRNEVIRDMDLIYSAGLFDYLPDQVANTLIKQLFVSLRPGGKMSIGNLKEAADTCFVMDYVVAWHLIYRTNEQMTKLATGLESTSRGIEVKEDATGHCMFLEVRR